MAATRFAASKRMVAPSLLRDLLDHPAAPAAAPRQKAHEAKGVGADAGDGDGGGHRARAGDGLDGDARVAGGGHQADAGIAHHRRPGVGDQRQMRPPFELAHQGLDLALLRVRVEALELRADAVMREQALGPPRVLGENEVRLPQGREGAQRHVVEVADGRGDDREAPQLTRTLTKFRRRRGHPGRARSRGSS